MSAELDNPVDRSVADPAALFVPLFDKGMGVLSSGYMDGAALAIEIEAGMPDDFKEVIASAAPGRTVVFVEISEEELRARRQYERNKAYHSTGYGRVTFIDTPMPVTARGEMGKILGLGRHPQNGQN